MPKQYFTIKDFSGGMNKEDAAQSLNFNESVILENLSPSGKGILKLDRNKITISEVGYESQALSAGYASFSFIDTAGQIVVLFLHNTDSDGTALYLRGIYDSDALDSWSDFNSGNAVKICTAIINHSKNSFINYNNIVRIGCDKAYYPAAMIQFVTISGGISTARSRFNSWSTYTLGLTDTPPYGLILQSTYTNAYGRGVYTPRIEKCNNAALDEDGATSPTLTNHWIGLYCVEAGSGTTSEYVVGDKVRYGVTLEFDYTQESPMAVSGTEDDLNNSVVGVTITVAGRPINLRIFVPGGTDSRWNGGSTTGTIFDERVTGINLYRQINFGDWYHLYRIDINDGLYDDIGTHIMWQDGTHGGLVNNCIALQEAVGGDSYFQDYDYARYESYKARTGFDNYNVYKRVNAGNDSLVSNTINVMILWNIGCMFRDRAIVNGLGSYINGQLRYNLHKRLYISKTGQPDVFPEWSYIELGTEESSDFIAIYPLSLDRWIAWDNNNCYVINASSDDPLGWYLEKTHRIGLETGNAVTIIPDQGLAFGNDQGLYLIDLYGNIIEASLNIRQDWRDNCNGANMALYYDRKLNVVFVGTTGRGDLFGYQLDFDKKVLYFWSDLDNIYTYATNGVVFQINSFFSGYNGETHITRFDAANNIIEVFKLESQNANECDLTWRGPELIFGDYFTNKRALHIWIKYKCYTASPNGIRVYLNGSTSPTSLGNIVQATTKTKAKFDCVYNFNSIQPEVFIGDSNQYFELYEWGITYKKKRPK